MLENDHSQFAADWVIAAVVLAALALLLGIAAVVCSIYGIVKQQALATLPYASVGYTFTGNFTLRSFNMVIFICYVTLLVHNSYS